MSAGQDRLWSTRGMGRHPRRQPSLANWASERRWLRGDGFEPPEISITPTQHLSLFILSQDRGAPHYSDPDFLLGW
jgi:hypothetical protein